MLRWVIGRLRCVGGKHERSLKLVQITKGDLHTSVCSFCRKPMIRRGKRDWIIARPD